RDQAAENVVNIADGLAMLALDSIHMENWTREDHLDAARRLELLAASLQARKTSPDVMMRLAREFAFAEQPEKARTILARVERETNDCASVRGLDVGGGWLRGNIAIAQHRFADAIQAFRASDLRFDGRPHNCRACTDAMLARAFDLAGMTDSAIAAFERY